MMSPQSLSLFWQMSASIKTEQNLRASNYKILDKYLKPYALRLKPAQYSFYVLNVDVRDDLRQFLSKRRIFLPAHWPQTPGCTHILYQRLLSVPLDSRYNAKDMQRIALTILEFLKPKRGQR
jgi:hypothetical protein